MECLRRHSAMQTRHGPRDPCAPPSTRPSPSPGGPVLPRPAQSPEGHEGHSAQSFQTGSLPLVIRTEMSSASSHDLITHFSLLSNNILLLGWTPFIHRRLNDWLFPSFSNCDESCYKHLCGGFYDAGSSRLIDTRSAVAVLRGDRHRSVFQSGCPVLHPGVLRPWGRVPVAVSLPAGGGQRPGLRSSPQACSGGSCV